jgi:hypothetical protein
MVARSMKGGGEAAPPPAAPAAQIAASISGAHPAQVGCTAPAVSSGAMEERMGSTTRAGGGGKSARETVRRGPRRRLTVRQVGPVRKTRLP